MKIKELSQLVVPSLVIMSAFLMVIIIPLMAGMSCVGCRTVSPTNQVDIATIGAVIKGISRSATLYAVRKEPKSTNYLSLTSIYLTDFSTNASLDPAALNRFIQSVPFRDRNTAEAQLAISTILTAYEIYWIRHPAPLVDRNKEFVKYLGDLSEGIRFGLQDYNSVSH